LNHHHVRRSCLDIFVWVQKLSVVIFLFLLLLLLLATVALSIFSLQIIWVLVSTIVVALDFGVRRFFWDVFIEFCE
jgi:hypothetical protein